MSSVSGTLQSGTYVVTNVASGNYATLRDANKASEVHASRDSDSDHVKWTVSKLSNNNYTVMSYVWATYAGVGASPNSGDRVAARSDPYQWVVRETSTRGVYLLYPTSDDTLYWGLVNSNPNTTVRLTDNADGRAKWTFTRVQA